MNQPLTHVLGKWQKRIGVVSSGYRLVAFIIAAIHLLVLNSNHYSLIPTVALVIGVGIYTLFKALYPLEWHRTGISGRSLLVTDIVICIFLVFSTGGLNSPFLLYTLAPVLTSALLLDAKVTFGIAGLSMAYVAICQLFNPFVTIEYTLPALSYFLVYVISLGLIATLPYLTNANLRRRLQSEDILRERQRLSREIHDGAAQTMAALCWQVQLLHRRLTEAGVDLPEVRVLEKLAERARQDIREPMELLRTYNGNGALLPYLKDYLEHLKRESHINFRLETEPEIHLESPVELELLRICQEALTNVRLHSRAHNIEVKLKRVNKHLEVSIADDGCGFDALPYYHSGVEGRGHGLSVMQERAESTGGSLRVLSMPGQGSEVQVEVPCAPHRGRLLWRK